MESEQQDDVQKPDDAASIGAAVDESKGEESHKSVGVRRGREEMENLTGRAYEYFHKIQ